MSTYRHSTADLAAELGVARKTVRKKAGALGLGIDLDGSAGFRYSDEDRRKLIESLRPPAPVAIARKKRPRRVTAANASANA